MKALIGQRLRTISRSRFFRYSLAVLIVLVLLLSLVDKYYIEENEEIQKNFQLQSSPVKSAIINVILQNVKQNLLANKNGINGKAHGMVQSYSDPVRILCYILLSRSRVKTARVIKDTWGSHCDDMLFFGGYEYPELPVTRLNVSEGYENLWGKAKAAILYLAENYKEKDYQYFLKADDDTFVIVENLRKFIKDSRRSLDKPIWFGFKLKHKRMPQGYMSGGAGYAFNYEALTRVSSILGRENTLPDSDHEILNTLSSCNVDGEYGVEDLELGKCFLNAGVESISTVDENGGERFLPVSYDVLLNGAISSFHWIWSQAWNRIKTISHLLKIRDYEARVPPYPQFEKIFHKLKNEVFADKPFIHFGGYKKANVFKSCIDKRCSPANATGSTPAPPVGGAQPPPGPPTTAAPSVAACPVPPPPPTPCPSGTHMKGPAPGTDVTVAGYQGCDVDCECCMIPPDEIGRRTIFSLQDGCELKYLKAPIASMSGSVLNPIPKDAVAKENPYRLDVTEIAVKGVNLRNWLHIKIYSNGTAGLSSEDLGEGKIKMAFIMVSDAMGFPVGEFVNNIPCGKECNCTDPKTCRQGTFEDTIPCMSDSKRVTLNPGMMMVFSDLNEKGQGFSEIHASWRYTQSASPENFATELHFRALLVDEFTHYKMLARDSSNLRPSAISERRVDKEGMFGWNPLYDILHPTIETVGAYDYFRDDVYSPDDVNCHSPLRPEHYTVEPYPDSGPTIRQIVDTAGSEREHCYRFNDTFADDQYLGLKENVNYCFGGGNFERLPVKCQGTRVKAEPWFHDAYGFISADEKVDPDQVYPWTLYGARTEAYILRDGGLVYNQWDVYNDDPQDIKLYWGIDKSEPNALEYAECSSTSASSGTNNYYGMSHGHVYPGPTDNYDVMRKYGHFCLSDGTGRRVLNLPMPVTKWPNTLAVLWKFPPVVSQSFMEDRCYCPRIPPTPDPRYREPPEVQVQGRRQHAYQMIIAWNCIVPFGIFVSRYYKETFSKVFFLQEYWWYTIHVLCMVSAAMFTFGGIYVMELKRRQSINWLDGNITVHVILGYTIITVFFLQVVSGFFRLKDPKKRLFQIFTHWLLGVAEYLLAIVCMVNAAFILLSGMTCEGVVAVGFLLVFQVMFYASMEVHMRNVDKLIKLSPPRSYLPPPIMRVFHKDAPHSKFRIQVLLAYFALCALTSLIQFLSMESNKLGESCFIKSKKYVEPTDLFGGE